MKLIIDIPEVDYECAKQRWARGNSAHMMDYYISKGIPLNKIAIPLNKIADEVNKLNKIGYDEKVYVPINAVFDIIDKYKVESEE